MKIFIQAGSWWTYYSYYSYSIGQEIRWLWDLLFLNWVDMKLKLKLLFICGFSALITKLEMAPYLCIGNPMASIKESSQRLPSIKMWDPPELLFVLF